MLEVYILTGILLVVVIGIPLYFIGAALYQRKQDKEHATKKKVYVSTLVLTYCGVGTDLMNKQRYCYRDYTEKDSIESYKKLQALSEQTYKKLETISDTDVFNFSNNLVIRKNQFIAIEIGVREEYE